MTSMSPPDPSPTADRRQLGDEVEALAADIARLDPGPLAQLRRGALQGAGAPAFWTLLARHGLAPIEGSLEGWAAVMQGIAIMTPRGRDRPRASPHDRSAPLGRQLATGGDPDWGKSGEPRAAFSELRLARLLEAGGAARRDLALRACRMLARHEARVDWRQMARLILFPDGSERTARQVARSFYETLDRQRRRQDEPEAGETVE